MIYKNIYIDTHKYIYIYIHIHTNIHPYTYNVYTYNTQTHTYARAHARPYMPECTHIYTHKYIHIQTEAARLGVTFMSHIYHIGGNRSPLY